jgi:hypothetical protein
LRLAWGQSLGSDWTALLLGTALGLTVLVPVLYWPALHVLRRLLGGYRPLMLFPLAATLLGLPLVLSIVRLRSGGFAALASPETTFLLVLFSGLGSGFGLGYAWGRATPRGSGTTSDVPARR